MICAFSGSTDLITRCMHAWGGSKSGTSDAPEGSSSSAMMAYQVSNEGEGPEPLGSDPKLLDWSKSSSSLTRRPLTK